MQISFFALYSQALFLTYLHLCAINQKDDAHIFDPMIDERRNTMKKMITAIMMAAAVGAIRADEAPHNEDCATPTEFVLNFLAHAESKPSVNFLGKSKSSDWVKRMNDGYSATMDMASNYQPFGDCKKGLSDEEYEKYKKEISNLDIEHGKAVAFFELRRPKSILGDTLPNYVEIRSVINTVEERTVQQGETWESLKALAEQAVEEHNDSQVDGCTECNYKYKVVIDEVRKRLLVHLDADCWSGFQREDLNQRIAAKRAEAAALAKLKAELDEKTKNS